MQSYKVHGIGDTVQSIRTGDKGVITKFKDGVFTVDYGDGTLGLLMPSEVAPVPVLQHTGAPSIYPHDRWTKMLDDEFDEIRHLAKAKGGEYSGDVDRLLNFRRNGTALDLPMETIWAVYAAKHWDAIQQYVRDLRNGTERERLEPINGRIRDLMVYLLLLNAMVEERNA